MQQLTTLELQYISESLMRAKNLDLAVPGTSFNFDWMEEEEEDHANPFNNDVGDNGRSIGMDISHSGNRNNNNNDNNNNSNGNNAWTSPFSTTQQSNNKSALFREQLAGQYNKRNSRYSRRGIRIQYFARRFKSFPRNAKKIINEVVMVSIMSY